MSTPQPKNFLEEMIQWTDSSILWHFPINNEQGVDEKEVNDSLQV
jgi:hypothetical protein